MICRKMRVLTASFISLIMLNGTAKAQIVDEVPNNTENHTVSQTLLDTITTALPNERGAIDQNFLNQDYYPNIYVSEEAQLAVTFIDEGAGYKNSLGYFTFNDSSFDGLTFGDIDTDSSGRISTSEISNLSGVTTDLVFPNASKQYAGGDLLMGDTVVIGGGSLNFNDDSWEIDGGTKFAAGTNIGFFLAANAWNDQGSTGTVDGWDGTAGDPYTYYSLDFLNPENNYTATIDDVDAKSRHVALTFESSDRDVLIMGFEDLYRKSASDDDFNDAVFLVRSDPGGAISDTDVEVYSAPAPALGGGLISLAFLLIAGLFKRHKI